MPVCKLPVLISGAGPTGLILALSLRRNGIPVRIIDKELKPRVGERGPGVSPRTQELHRILGTSTEIMKAMKPLPISKQYDPIDGHKVVRTFDLNTNVEPTPHLPYTNPLILGQNHHEAIIRARLLKLSTPVEFGSELRTFTQSGDSVATDIIRHPHNADGQVTIEKAEFSYLVGTDGAHSIVRRTLGFQFLGETREGECVIVGGIEIVGERREFWERWGTPPNMISLRPSVQDANITNFLIAGDIDAVKLMSGRDAVVEEFYASTGRRDIVFGNLIWLSKYRPNIRMVSQLRSGQVFIGGDAAHCHSPAGGQGLNSSMQDAFNLGWKLALVHKGLAPETLLDTYQEERLPVIAEMLNKTTEMHNKIWKAGADPSIKRGTDMNQLGVNYRGSSILIEDDSPGEVDKADEVLVSGVKVPGYNKESETAARAGDRAPEAPGLTLIKPIAQDQTPSSLFSIFSPSMHTVLVFSTSADEHRALFDVLGKLPLAAKETVQSVAILKQDDRYPKENYGESDIVAVDAEGYAHAGYHIAEAETCFVVVRPDGIVGARVRSSDGVGRYLGGIFDL